MSGRHLLDTSVVVAALRGNPEIAAHLTEALEVFLPVVVLGELYFGAANSDRPEESAAQVEDFAATCTLLDVDPETAQIYGRIKGDLRKKGRPIPENDLWISALALRHDLTLVARDEHFALVEGLRVEAW